MDSSDGLGALLANAATVAGFLLLLLGFVAGLRGWIRRTIGRRRHHAALLQRLGTNVQASYFTAVLGTPPALSRTFASTVTTPAEQPGDTSERASYLVRALLIYRRLRVGVSGELDAEMDEQSGDEESGLVQVPIALVEAVWVDRDYYVQALVHPDETVLAFSVTTRTAKFQPVLGWPPREPPSFTSRMAAILNVPSGHALVRVRLGKTHFDEAVEDPDWGREGVFASLGAHDYRYSEVYWFGNPGSFQYFVLSSIQAGAHGWPDLMLLFPEGSDRIFRQGVWGDEAPEDADLDTFRRRSVVNTYTVIGPRFQLEDYPLSFGVNYEDVRVIP